MTEEELRKEATSTLEWECAPMIDRPFFVHAYIRGALPRERRIEELLALIQAERKRQALCDDIHLRKIAELTRENAELKTEKIPQLERKIASIRGAHSVDCKKLNARTEQVERLKKENAELKKKNLATQDAVTMQMYTNKANKEIADKQLTKAKKIIESLLPFEHVIDPYALTSDIEENRKRFHEPFRKAEQFLKEVSE